MKLLSPALLFVLFMIFSSCKSKDELPDNNLPEQQASVKALIVSVGHSGNAENYNFQVGISSPDTGCDQYADWWEVVTEEGALVYRRVLGHSHVNEQPFVRSGGGIAIASDQIVIVRAHMNVAGYNNQSYRGSVADGFEPYETEEGFGANLETVEPLPSDCAF